MVDLNQSALPGAVRVILLPAGIRGRARGHAAPARRNLYMLRRRHARAPAPLCAVPRACSSPDVIIANVFHQVSYSEMYFQDTGYVAGCIVAADGLRAAPGSTSGARLPASQRAATVALGLLDSRPWLAWSSPPCRPNTTSQIASLRDAAFAHRWRACSSPGWLRCIARLHSRPTVGYSRAGTDPDARRSRAHLTDRDRADCRAGAQRRPGRVRQDDPAAGPWPHTRSAGCAAMAARRTASVERVIAVSNHWLDAAKTRTAATTTTRRSRSGRSSSRAMTRSRYEISTSWSTATGGFRRARRC